MDRAEVEARIDSCRRCRDENCDCPEVVARMNDRIDVLQELHDAIPVQP